MRYACILWTDEDQYSVVPASDVMGDVNEGDEGTVAWRIVGKGKKIDTKWYKAKILKYSVVQLPFSLLRPYVRLLIVAYLFSWPTVNV